MTNGLTCLDFERPRLEGEGGWGAGRRWGSWSLRCTDLFPSNAGRFGQSVAGMQRRGERLASGSGGIQGKERRERHLGYIYIYLEERERETKKRVVREIPEIPDRSIPSSLLFLSIFLEDPVRLTFDLIRHIGANGRRSVAPVLAFALVLASFCHGCR